ncbi:Na+/H+ antiporter [Mycobacterium sp. CVI_P3]|uniref:Na+/H+ antiporter n=1 Tax=Mycobacterium pinniadriaticum TaxID=2994102 RepID=A0ABT3SJ16_9MYCO|nr:Na+/H+ antiporter [Mycobacterium pinniadriaticum]MCX2933090.1 Na+/H+ antiporter [Mycobacterium pinniadriaticum]MCX2939512.1 Na+/H+ antiporter [Mycobacterium pinniadriaticum]
MNATLLAVLAAAMLLTALARRYNLSSPLVLVVAGLGASLIPDVPEVHLNPDLVLFVILPPLLWSAGLESSSVALRRSFRPVAGLAVGLPLATTFAVGYVAYLTVPGLTLPSALALGAIVAPPDAVSATAIGRRLGLPRQIMTLIGGESLLNDATALTVYKVFVAAAVGVATSWGSAVETFLLAVAGGAVVGLALGHLIVYLRSRLDDPLTESAIGLLAPFVVYLVADQIGGSGVLAVVIAALILGHRSARAGYATRLQDEAVWRAVQLVLEAFAFFLIGLQLPAVLGEIRGMPAIVMAGFSLAVLGTVIGVRIAWVYAFTYLPRLLSPRARSREPAPSAAGVFVVAWAGMRGVVSLAAAFGLPTTTLSGAPFPGRAHLVYLTFVVVVGTLLLHGLTLPWIIRKLGVTVDDTHADIAAANEARQRATLAAADRLDTVLAEHEAEGSRTDVHDRVADILRVWNVRRREAAVERLQSTDSNLDESPVAALRRLRLQMLEAEREAYIAERDSGRIDDEVLRTALRELDLEEAVLDRE